MYGNAAYQHSTPDYQSTPANDTEVAKYASAADYNHSTADDNIAANNSSEAATMYTSRNFWFHTDHAERNLHALCGHEWT